jgi:hypothetical protein
MTGKRIGQLWFIPGRANRIPHHHGAATHQPIGQQTIDALCMK